MKRPVTKTALFIRDDQKDSLKRLSDKTGAPMSEIIRRAIDAYLKSAKVVAA